MDVRAENSTSASVSRLGHSGQGLSCCDYCFLFKMWVVSDSRRPPPVPRPPPPMRRTALTNGIWQLRYWGVSKVQILCGPADSMEAKLRTQGASAQILLLPTTELPPILKCTVLPLGFFCFCFLRRKHNCEAGLHSNLLRWRDRICAETQYWSAQREAAVPSTAEPRPGRQGGQEERGAALGSSGRLWGRCSFGLSSPQHAPLGPLKPCPDRCCGQAAPPWWRPARIPFHRIWTWAQETARPERKETAQLAYLM